MKYPCSYVDLAESITPDDIVRDGYGKCSWHANRAGVFKLSNVDSSLYSVEVWKNAGHFTIADGTGRPLFKQHSVFTGSFLWQGYAEKGLFCRIGAGLGICPNITIMWLEVND